MGKMWLGGGRVIDPSQSIDEIANVLIQDGRIEAVGRDIQAPDDAQVIDVSGQVVAPGLIDVHVHFREPGKEDAETIGTGARSAAAGGFTSVCTMPNTTPVTDNPAAIGFALKQAEVAGAARVLPIGAITLGQEGKQLAEIGKLVDAGAVAISDDGHPVESSHMMRTALEYAQIFDIPVADHCEEPTLAKGGSMHEGVVSTRLGLKGIPSAAEEIMVARDVILAELTGGHVHLCHMSTRGSVDIIRRAKEHGIKVTAEVTPHHLVLTHDMCDGYDTNSKMNPPLREAEDVEALQEALKDGTIDMIATDHAPHHYEQKERDFAEAPFGIIGLETALPVMLADLVETGIVDLPSLILRMSTEPAKAFRIDGGTLRRGSPADVVVFDPKVKGKVDVTRFKSKSRNTPFGGREIMGRILRTIVAGRTVFDAGSE